MMDSNIRQLVGAFIPSLPKSRGSGIGFPMEMLVRLAQMVGWRVFALAFGAAGSIWAARCLGPEKLGISGMIVATITQLVILVDLNQNAHLIRRFKATDDVDERNRLVAAVFTFRSLLCLAVMLLAGLVCLSVSVPPEWRVALVAAFPLFLANSNQGIWVLQANEDQPAQYRAGAVQAVISAGAYLLLFRPGIAPGWDVVVQAVALGASWYLMWRWAMGAQLSSLWQPRQWKEALPVIKEGRWLMLTGVVVYIYTQSEAPLLGYLGSIEEMGRYRSATSLLGVAQSFLTMIPILLYPRFIEWLKEGAQNLWHRQIQLARVAIAISVPVIVVAFIVSPRFFLLAFGAPFAAAAYPFCLLLASKLVVVVNGIFGWGLWAMKKDRQMLAVMVVTAVVSISANLLLIPRFGMMAAASVNLACEVLILAGCFVLTRRAVFQSVS
jgi:O-antigen/teichoic acid export membrane protein